MSDARTTTGTLVKRGALPITTVAVTSSSVASPSVILTGAPHGLETGQTVTIAGHTGSTPNINGDHVVTVTDPTHFTIPVNVTVGGTGGTILPDYPPLVTVGELTTIGLPGYSRNKIGVSTHNEGVEASVLGILRQKDPGFTINYLGNNTTHQAIRTDIRNNVRSYWQFALPSGTRFGADGYVQQFMMADAPVDAAQQANVVLVWAEEVLETEVA